MDLSKFSDDDLEALRSGDLSKVSDEGLQEMKRQQTAPSAATSEMSGAADLGRAAMSAAKTIGDYTKAGYAGIADLVAGNGLDKSVENIEHVKKGEDTTSAASTIGEALGSQFTPGMIASQAVAGKIGEVIGPKVASLMKGWAEDMAVNAVGKIKSIAKAVGVDNLDEVGRFLLEPVSLGGEEFDPIVTAGSSPQQMLSKARSLMKAAGDELKTVAGKVDVAAKGVSDDLVSSANGTVAPVLDTESLLAKVKAAKEEAVGDLPRLGKAVGDQFDDAISDLEDYIRKQATGANVNAFSKLASIKTKIGGLVFKHGSPLDSKAALNDVYHIVSDALDKAANNVEDKTVSDSYALANSVYHKAASIEAALEGKVVDAKKWFDTSSIVGALAAVPATMGHGLASLFAVPAAAVASKTAATYGPQAIAAGLEATHPLVAKGIELTARGVPVVANAISQMLGQ